MFVTLILGVFAGYYLDSRFHTGPWFTVIGSILGIIAGLYNLIKRFSKIK
ncbi:MAG: AtpZ/AtpI family protein [Elusimicrobiota bacterium]